MNKYTDQEQARRNKLDFYALKNIIPFKKAYKLGKITYSDEIIKNFNKKSREDLEKNVSIVSIAGRIIGLRGPFIIVKDYHGKIQTYYNKKTFPKYSELVNSLDLGDIVLIKGEVMKTHTNEISLRATKIELLTKSLKPLPEKYHGLTDVEEKYRHRYLDLITNDDSVKAFWTRTNIIKIIRSYFDNLEYMEVETPILSDYLSGAAARPFTTHHNALNQEFTLRIATEIALKKLIVGGIDRVYEIGRIFRNEGYDTTHNPEFTSIEFYEAYSNIEGMMNRTEKLFKEIAKTLKVKTVINNGIEIDLTKPFNKIDMIDAVSKATSKDFRNITFEEAVEIAKTYNIKIEKFFTTGHIINSLFEELIEKTLIQPTFVYGHPIEISPLTAKADDPRFVERAELFINTKEYANMYTELSDPIDQLERFESQLEEKNSGNDEASDIDYDFIEALEYGMPPTGGCGIGIDRLVMLFAEKSSIRDVLLFPTLRRIKK
ncbi:MAG: lysine--tRNA ligase [Metamycoplasmataceae bacterium]